MKKAYKGDVSSWTLIRHVYNWTEAFQPYKCDFSGISTAHHFHFTKNENGLMVMHYKTNSLDEEWKGWDYSEKGTKTSLGISVCKDYIKAPPAEIPPKPIDEAIIQSVTSTKAFQPYYDQPAKNFWLSLKNDSLAYLSEPLYPNEGNCQFLPEL